MKRICVLLVCMLVASISVGENMPELVNNGIDAYQNGNYKVAFELLTKAAKAGDVSAQANLGVAYFGSKNFLPDFTKAKYWLEKSIRGNSPQGAFNLGLLYEQGKGEQSNIGKAIGLFELSADRGYLPAQKELGMLYMQGTLVKQDLIKAYKWYSLAALQNDNVASNMLVVLSKQMTKEQLSQANKLVQQFKPKK